MNFVLLLGPYHLSGVYITAPFYLPTLLHRASSSQTQVYMAFHRIEFTWFHYSLTCTCFLLHLSSPKIERVHFRVTAVSRYAALWCPDFPPCSVFILLHGDKAVCWLQKYIFWQIMLIKNQNYNSIQPLKYPLVFIFVYRWNTLLYRLENTALQPLKR